jgi:SAM-dependent methyltransferase
MSNLVELNNLVINENRVYRLPGQEGVSFDYSDGRDVEQYLKKVFSGAKDLGSRSRELQEKIIDWPSEYHLSSDRSNILRPYDLSFARKALEFGSGCGAISRYLGEQGIAVDAVEGSEIRASLGKMRCRDLDNVSVINANYNDLDYPEKHYDVILFIGVIEYASKFHPDAETDREAAIAILNHVRRFLKDDGVIIVAIENRLGLKYILGHHEDHYAKKYIGIHGYQDSAGIATYSDSEWREISREAGLAHCGFSFPFPDYKIPRVTFGEEFSGTTPHAFNHLEGLYSRDYARPVKKSPTESIAWEASNSGGFLNTIANSFCLALGNDASRVDQIMDFDFCHTPGPGRQNSFAVVTRKKKGSNIVEKIPVSPLSSGPSTQQSFANVTQVLGNQEYLKGNLLSTEWLRSILIYSRREEFDALLGSYYDYLGELESSGQSLKIDMLPINIIVADDGSYQLFDQEWEVAEPVSREYLLFRALLTFIVTNWIHMKDFLGWLELHSVRDFVDYGFRNHKLQLVEYLDEFVSRENRFQQATIYIDGERGVQQLLETRFDFSSDDRDIYSTLFWAGPGEEFDIARSLEKSLEPDPESQQIVFRTEALKGPVKSVRLDPFDIRKTDQIGFYSISEIQIVSCGSPVNGAGENVLWQLEGEQAVAENCVAQSAWFEPLADHGFWLSSTEFPKMHFELDQAVEAASGEHLEIRVRMGIAESPEYILAHHRYISRLRQMQQTEEDLKKSLHHLKSAKTEIADIKAGKPFRLGMKIFSMLGFLKK